FLIIKRVLDVGFSVLERGNACGRVLCNFQDYVALLGTGDVREITRFHRERFVFKFLRKNTAFEYAKSAAVSGGGTVGVFLGQIVKVGSIFELLEQIIGFGFGGSEGSLLGCFVGGAYRCDATGSCGLGVLTCISSNFWGDQYFTKP